MTTPAHTAPIMRATIGLPDGEAKALRRWLMGRSHGCAGAAIQPGDVARRLRAWLAERRAEEAEMLRQRRVEEVAALVWLKRHGA